MAILEFKWNLDGGVPQGSHSDVKVYICMNITSKTDP